MVAAQTAGCLGVRSLLGETALDVLKVAAPLAGLAPNGEFDEEADFGLFATPEAPSSIVLRAGEMAVLAPEDAHKPGCAADEPGRVRKIVVKVRA